MEIEKHGEQVTFRKFCERHRISLVAHERSKHSGLDRWYVSPRGLVEVRENGMLISVSGNGSTPEAALADYARQLAGRTLLIGGYSGGEVVAPNEWREPREEKSTERNTMKNVVEIMLLIEGDTDSADFLAENICAELEGRSTPCSPVCTICAGISGAIVKRATVEAVAVKRESRL